MSGETVAAQEEICTLLEKCPNTEVFWSVFRPNEGKYGPENIRIWTLFTQC